MKCTHKLHWNLCECMNRFYGISFIVRKKRKDYYDIPISVDYVIRKIQAKRLVLSLFSNPKKWKIYVISELLSKKKKKYRANISHSIKSKFIFSSYLTTDRRDMFSVFSWKIIIIVCFVVKKKRLLTTATTTTTTNIRIIKKKSYKLLLFVFEKLNEIDQPHTFCGWSIKKNTLKEKNNKNNKFVRIKRGLCADTNQTNETRTIMDTPVYVGKLNSINVHFIY